MDVFKKGTCKDMCSMSEIKKRSREKLVHFYEQKYGVFIKEFTRSAAGQSAQSSCDLRTKEALTETLRFLLTE